MFYHLPLFKKQNSVFLPGMILIYLIMVLYKVLILRP